jgi:hypothetical protein
MDAGDVAQIITALAAFGAFLNSLRNARSIKEVAIHVVKVEAATNGMKSELVNEVRSASFAAGEKSEKDRGETTRQTEG